MHVRANPRRRRGVSLTAMTDIVFLLLLFFMVTSTFTRYSQIELTAGRAGVANEAPAPGILIRIDVDGEWQVNGISLEVNMLGEEIARLEASGAETAMLLPRAGVTTQQLISALETVRMATALPVSLVR